ncbi:MAG: phenylalanine--tRNA ligase subunit beta [Sedimentisphaerales bacterium]|nr:phenylalanine--tRNA ligase subunit beta [Sedimentisphaerales bacterium]
MKISLDWLSDYVQIDRSAPEIAEILSNLGFPTEGIERVGDDTVIDVEITSNRGDCLSHIGIARELAAATGKTLRLPQVKLQESEQDISEFVNVMIDEPQLCGRYTARVITGVRIGPSPDWMVRRLEAVGIRSINNVVDATNYAMMESGQPPHAFDYATLRGKKIIVRKGFKGEQIVSIDETKCDCDDQMLMIADAEGPVAIAGVMGGLYTEISEKTTTVLLEEAHFDPVSVRTTSRKLAIPSEASFRFERQVDIEKVDEHSKRCAELIVQVAGGQVARGVADAYPGKPEAQTVAMRLSRMKHLLGIDVPADTVMNIFAGLGFHPDKRRDDLIVCTVPSWRHDLYREVDLIEEVARCHGFDKIPVEPRINIQVAPMEPREKLAGRIRSTLNACGFFETVNVTFTDDKTWEALAHSQAEPLCVKDVSRKSANILRQTLLGSLLQTLRANANMKNSPCRLFELAVTFCPNPDPEAVLPIQRDKLALAADADFRDLRGAIEAVCATVSPKSKVQCKQVDLPWAKPGAEILLDDTVIGAAGVISKTAAAKLDLPEGAISAAELDFLTLLELQQGIGIVKSIPRFPSITRDLSLILDEPITWEQIQTIVNANKPGELETVDFVGIYRGKPIPDGKKSLTLSLRFRDEEGTLTHEIVDGFEKTIVHQLTSQLKAELRAV